MRDWLPLLRFHADPEPLVTEVMRRWGDGIDALGGEPRGLDVLDLGCGPRQTWSHVLGVHNRVTSVDEAPVGLRGAGPTRAVKTLARRALGLDHAYRRALARALGVRRLHRRPADRGDAHALPYADGSFDLVVSVDVFEHLVDPEAALAEVRRVLRPGGRAWISVHLWTSDSGAHDPRSFRERRGDLPAWAHLRPRFQDRVRPNAWVNRWTLAQWRALAARHGAELRLRMPDRWLEGRLGVLRAELSAYNDDELLTTFVDLVL